MGGRKTKLNISELEKISQKVSKSGVLVAMILADVIVEQTSVKERGQLGENVFVIIHLPRVSAKVKFKSVDSKNLWN